MSYYGEDILQKLTGLALFIKYNYAACGNGGYLMAYICGSPCDNTVRYHYNWISQNSFQ